MTKNAVSRRQFLNNAAGAMAIPYVITSNALGGPDTPPASDRITVGHIGVGGRGNIFEFQNVKECVSLAVADPYKDRAAARAAL